MSTYFKSLKVVFLQTNLNKMYKSFWLLFLLFPLSFFGQDDYINDNALRFEDKVYDDKIKSVQLYNTKDEMSYPIISHSGNEQLKLSFDELTNELSTFYYTVIHCNTNWTPSDILPSQYLTNFIEDDIEDYKYSFNTDVKYIHYNLLLPNQDFGFKLAGNYLLKVYRLETPDKPIITKRFIVYKNQVETAINVKNAVSAKDRFYVQEVDFNIELGSLPIRNPMQNIDVILMQNYRWDNAITGLKPKYINGSLLDYNHEYNNVFSGINEFRNFDIKSLNFNSINIYQMNYDKLKGKMTVELYQEEKRAFKQYLNKPDLNGNFLIKRDESNDSEVEAEYVDVVFNLKTGEPVEGGNLYLLGKFTDWAFKDEYKLQFDESTRSYTLTALLKQGYYDYMYCFVPDNSKSTGNISEMEGEHHQTENDYTILVYYRDPMNSWDEVIGIKTVNSNRR